MYLRRRKVTILGLFFCAVVFMMEVARVQHGNSDVNSCDESSISKNTSKNVFIIDGKYIDTLSLLHDSNYVPRNISRSSCEQLIQGNVKEFVDFPYAKKIDYSLETENCRDFIRKRGYIFGGTEEETGFPIAFSILMYKDVEQAERLLRAIYRPSNHYCVHVDKNASYEVQREMKSIVKCLPNVFLPLRQVNVQWSTFTVLEAELVCMRDLMKRPGWKYFINLTGQEFPLKTNLELVRILKILNGTNSVDANTQKLWRRLRKWLKFWPPPHRITPYKGNTHAVVSRDFVDFALSNPKVQHFVEWLKNTSVPDESFFSTLDNNPHLGTPGSFHGRISTDYDLKPYIARFKNWGPGWGMKSFDWPCRGKRVRQICIFGVRDLPLLVSRRELFANKFYIDFQPQTLDCIEEWHRNRTIEEYKGAFEMNYDFYKHMPQVKCKNRS